MNTRYLEDEDIDEVPRDREISLGATTILGIFFLVALVCAVFFEVAGVQGVGLVSAADCGLRLLFSKFISSMGSGKTMVVFFSTPISVNV